MKVTMTQRSDPGRVRSGNEDSVHNLADPAGRRGHLLIVADGMGGANAGEVASRIAVETVAEVFFGSDQPPAAALRQAFVEANHRICGAGESPDKAGMGTTCSALALYDKRAWVAHVGDSRIYRLRRATLERLTRVHSIWAEQVSNHGIPPSIRAGQNVLTRALGAPGELEVDIGAGIDLESGDRFLLCSDGLWGLVTDPEIADAAARDDLDAACGILVDLANDRGGPDNISIVLAAVVA